VICILLFATSPLVVLLPSLFSYVQEVKATTIIIMFFFRCANLFTITTPSCDFALGFGLHLFSNASPYSLTPLSLLLCAKGGSGNGHHHIFLHCRVFLQVNKPFSPLLYTLVLLLFLLVYVCFLVFLPL
jgi:hypothetical protein